MKILGMFGFGMKTGLVASIAPSGLILNGHGLVAIVVKNMILILIKKWIIL
jgi:hypothetical protein